MKLPGVILREDAVCTVYRMEQDVDLKEYLETCVNVPYFHELCKVCPNYDRRWSCPGFDFDPMDTWRQYKRLHLVADRMVPKVGRTLEVLLRVNEREKRLMIDELQVMEEQIPGSLALWAGTCPLCETCARAEGRPCRRPGEMRHSIEAMGGDVGKTAEAYLGWPIQWIKDGEVPEYLMLVGGLLCDKK